MSLSINTLSEAGFFLSAFQKYAFEPEDFYTQLKRFVTNEIPFIIIVENRKILLREKVVRQNGRG